MGPLLLCWGQERAGWVSVLHNSLAKLAAAACVVFFPCAMTWIVPMKALWWFGQIKCFGYRRRIQQVRMCMVWEPHFGLSYDIVTCLSVWKLLGLLYSTVHWVHCCLKDKTFLSDVPSDIWQTTTECYEHFQWAHSNHGMLCAVPGSWCRGEKHNGRANVEKEAQHCQRMPSA